MAGRSRRLTGPAGPRPPVAEHGVRSAGSGTNGIRLATSKGGSPAEASLLPPVVDGAKAPPRPRSGRSWSGRRLNCGRRSPERTSGFRVASPVPASYLAVGAGTWWGESVTLVGFTSRLDEQLAPRRATSRSRHRKTSALAFPSAARLGYLLARRLMTGRPHQDDPRRSDARRRWPETRPGRGWRDSTSHRACRRRSDPPGGDHERGRHLPTDPEAGAEPGDEASRRLVEAALAPLDHLHPRLPDLGDRHRRPGVVAVGHATTSSDLLMSAQGARGRAGHGLAGGGSARPRSSWILPARRPPGPNGMGPPQESGVSSWPRLDLPAAQITAERSLDSSEGRRSVGVDPNGDASRNRSEMRSSAILGDDGWMIRGRVYRTAP